ncbi:hypothetical protein [Planctobacterium marinum]|uniref:hypothetical protein n=1 Tax=Planctobacterium marinum TaxID=1631968 RepID=UPI001E603B58|nr:hypothetical protein [Planctobacterium marinum]MCC2608182.1 hypothetical protein [Planctobacterium marinum]
MNHKVLLLALSCSFLFGCSGPESCKVFEYGSLSLSSASVIKDDEVKRVNFTAIWSDQEKSITWYDFQPISGNTPEEFKDYFGAKINHPISVLSALGLKGWEVYDYERHNQNESIQLTDWQLKRCVQ